MFEVIVVADIYTVENHIDYIIRFLEEKINSSATLYKPSKVRYETLIQKFNTAIKLTTRILQDNELVDTEEFNDVSDVEQIYTNLLQLTSKCENLEKLFEKSLGVTNTPVVEELTIEDKKTILCQYQNCINNLVMNVDSSSIEYLRECAYIIKQWFDARYKAGELEFKYDVKTLPTWIVGIVVTYSQHIQTSTTQDFVLQFSEWMDHIDVNPMFSTYPVPYNIYTSTKNVIVDKSALTTLVLWDLLYDNGFYLLDLCKVPCAKDIIYTRFLNLNNMPDSTLSLYKDYKKDNNILYKANLLVRDGE